MTDADFTTALQIIDGRLRNIETGVAALPCKHHVETIGRHNATLFGAAGNEAESPGLVERVATVEAKAAILGRWLNSLLGAAAGILVSLATAAIIALATHLANGSTPQQNNTPPPATRPAGQANPPAATKGESHDSEETLATGHQYGLGNPNAGICRKHHPRVTGKTWLGCRQV